MKIYHSTTLASTVGTSVLINLERLSKEGFDSWLTQQPEDQQRSLGESRNGIERAAAAFRAGRWEDVGKELEKLPRCRLTGAEIASMESLDTEDGMDRITSIYLLHTPTDDGAASAEIIRTYALTRWNKWADLVEIGDLDHRNEDRFRTRGLRNLAAAFAGVYEKAGDKKMVIDATGGYKAQIAIAVVFGQVFDVPVMYRYESFRHKIWLPALPVRPDLSVVAENLDLLEEDNIPAGVLRERFGSQLTEANEAFAAFRVCLEEPAIRIDEEDHYPVSAFGAIMLRRWYALTPAHEPGLPAAEEPASVNWGAHHWPDGIREFAARLAQEARWITRIETRPSTGLSHGSGIHFRLLRSEGENIPDLECLWLKRDNFPVKLVLKTTAGNRRQQEKVLHFLKEKWGK